MVDEFIVNVGDYTANSKECDLYLLYQGLTLDTICKSAMGVNFDIQKNLETDKLLKQVRSMLAFGMNVVVILIGETNDNSPGFKSQFSESGSESSRIVTRTLRARRMSLICLEVFRIVPMVPKSCGSDCLGLS